MQGFCTAWCLIVTFELLNCMLTHLHRVHLLKEGNVVLVSLAKCCACRSVHVSVVPIINVLFIPILGQKAMIMLKICIFTGVSKKCVPLAFEC